MIKYLFILFILFSCSYPDIDTVPKFENMGVSIYDYIDLCKLTNSGNEEPIDCFKELKKVINRL